MKNNLDVLIYTTEDCSYCKKAKLIFKKFKIKYNEIIINNELDRIEMSRLSNGRKTVPQIFIKKKHIGGYDDLNYLKKSGKLDKFLN
jgi:Glutaredoxin, GrxC family|tara:strand:+ start:322 stop:582 length:261 start_codon:yes stop_codon:yes gene_type:complete